MDPDFHHAHHSTVGYQSDFMSSGHLSCSSSLSSFSDAGMATNHPLSGLKPVMWGWMWFCCLKCSLSDKLLSARVYPDSQIQRSSIDPPGGSGLMFPLPGCNISRPDASKPWAGGAGSSAPRAFGGAGGEVDEETKKNQNIINIVREGQISLLVSADDMDQWKSRK